MNVRRVVTGHDDGKAVIVDDQVVEPTTLALTPTACTTNFGADSRQPFPTPAPTRPRQPSSSWGGPFFLFTFPPGDNAADLEGVDIEAGLRQLQEAGVSETDELDEPGTTTTRSTLARTASN